MKKQIILGSFLAFTGIFNAQTGTWTYGTNKITTTNNVGIGKTSPVKSLDIESSIPYDGISIKQMNTSTGAHATLRLDNAGGNNYGFCSSGAQSQEGPGHFFLYDHSWNRYLLFFTGGSSGGNAGFGTSSPAAKLDVLSTSNPLRLSYSASIFSDLQTTSGGNLYINPTGGKVGIGTNNPARKLSVNGDVAVGDVASGYGIEILGGGQTPYRRGISTDTDPTLGHFDFFINNNQSGTSIAEFRFKEGAANRELMKIDGGGKITIKNFYANGTDDAFTISDGSSGVKNFGIKKNGNVQIGLTAPKTPHTDAKLSVDGKVVAQSLYITASGSANWADYVFDKDYKVPNLYDIEKYYQANQHLPEIPSAKEVGERGIDVGEMNALLLKKIEEMTILMVKQQKEIDELKTKIK